MPTNVNNVSKSTVNIPLAGLPLLQSKSQPRSKPDTIESPCCCSCLSKLWDGLCDFFSGIWNGLFGKSQPQPPPAEIPDTATVQFEWANEIIKTYEEDNLSPQTYKDLKESRFLTDQFQYFTPRQQLEFLIELTHVDYQIRRREVPKEVLESLIQKLPFDEHFGMFEFIRIIHEAANPSAVHQELLELLKKYTADSGKLGNLPTPKVY